MRWQVTGTLSWGHPFTVFRVSKLYKEGWFLSIKVFTGKLMFGIRFVDWSEE